MADQKLSALTELAATPANDDEVYIRDISEAASAESKRITVANLLAGAGGAATASGTYTGNDSADRSIAHGMGITPTLVFIGETNVVWRFKLLEGQAFIGYEHGSGVNNLAVTAPDGTNFQVGNATQYSQSANANTVSYHWVAIG